MSDKIAKPADIVRTIESPSVNTTLEPLKKEIIIELETYKSEWLDGWVLTISPLAPLSRAIAAIRRR